MDEVTEVVDKAASVKAPPLLAPSDVAAALSFIRDSYS
ncbi:hypothetical protein O999_03255 [Pseudomonas putida LF54]|nr:hypothetical protein O999_03255 [Pseudomonas putida LF54]